MKKCPDKEKLSRYLDGEISPPERHLLDNHLRKCKECRLLLAELKAVEIPLAEISRPNKSLRKKKSGCIGEERIIAYIEDRLPDEARREVAIHLASCRFCSQVASEARMALNTIAAVRRHGLKNTPEMLAQKAAAIFIPPKQSYLGSIIVELKELLFPSDEEVANQRLSEREDALYISEPPLEGFMAPRKFYEGSGGKLDGDEIMEQRIEGSSQGVFRCPPIVGAAQHAGLMSEKLVKATQSEPVVEYTYKKPWMNLVVSFYPVKHGEAHCTITLKDSAGYPAPGVSMHIGADSTKPFFRRTDEKGVIELVVFSSGRYKLIIDYMQGASLDIKIV